MIIKLKNHDSLINLDSIRSVTKFEDRNNTYLKFTTTDGQEIKLFYGVDTSGREYAKKRDEDFELVEKCLTTTIFNSEDVKILFERMSDIVNHTDRKRLEDGIVALQNFGNKYYAKS